MNTSPVQRELERAEQVDYVASHLLPRAALLVRLLVKQVRTTDISRTEGEVLVILDEGPRRITELAELEGLAQPTVTALVKRLEHKRWVSREDAPHDGRVVLVTITDDGRAALARFRAHFLDALRTDLDRVSDEQLIELVTATETLGAFVEQLPQGAPR